MRMRNSMISRCRSFARQKASRGTKMRHKTKVDCSMADSAASATAGPRQRVTYESSQADSIDAGDGIAFVVRNECDLCGLVCVSIGHLGDIADQPLDLYSSGQHGRQQASGYQPVGIAQSCISRRCRTCFERRDLGHQDAVTAHTMSVVTTYAALAALIWWTVVWSICLLGWRIA